MPVEDDLKSHATTSTHDFYALLDIPSTSSDADIRRAYRKTALKYHPDKLSASASAATVAAAADKFHLLQIAYDVLSEPAVRALYDNARAAREQKKRQHEMLEGRRREMKESLERRERGVKRGRDDGDEDAEERLEREVRRLAEDGKRRRRQREEMLRREIQREEEEARARDGDGGGGVESEETNGTNGANQHPTAAATGIPEISRTVKVRWPRHGQGLQIDKDRLETLFSTFGKIESVFLLKDKKIRPSTSAPGTRDKPTRKTLTATGVIVYASLIGAYAAVADHQKQQGDEWRVFESVFWAAGHEPDIAIPTRTAPSTPSHTTPTKTPAPPPNLASRLNAPNANTKSDADPQIRKVPSFASFGAASAASTPSAKNRTIGANSPSLEEITMIRLRNAEKRRLEDELRREDAAAAAAAAATSTVGGE